MAHQLACAIYGTLKGCTLACADVALSACCLALTKGVVYLVAGGEQSVAEVNQSLLLLCLGNGEVGALSASAEDIYSELCGKREYPAAWRCYRLAELILPA